MNIPKLLIYSSMLLFTLSAYSKDLSPKLIQEARERAVNFVMVDNSTANAPVLEAGLTLRSCKHSFIILLLRGVHQAESVKDGAFGCFITTLELLELSSDVYDEYWTIYNRYALKHHLNQQETLYLAIKELCRSSEEMLQRLKRVNVRFTDPSMCEN